MDGFHLAHFGDGTWAWIIEHRNGVNERTGVPFVKFIFKIPDIIKQRYPSILEYMGPNDFIVREYPHYHVVFLEQGTYRTTAWVMCDFDGGETIMTRRTQDLTVAIDDAERYGRISEAAKNVAMMNLTKERTQIAASLKDYSNIIKEVASARGKLPNDEDAGMGEEESGGE